MKLPILLSLLATLASAGTVTQFSANSTGIEFVMNLAGVDDQGDQITASYYPGFGEYPVCACTGGQLIQIGGLIGATGYATINGVGYGGPTLVGSNEWGFLSISGVLPPIAIPVGSQGMVTFPITWSVDLTFFQTDASGIVPIFELNGAGTGMASVNMAVIESNDAPYYEGDDFAFVADAPEPASWAMCCAGLLACGLIARKTQKRGAKA